jgi:hypothetical protein
MKIKKHPTKNKAEEMLHDGTAHGHKLTAKQKRYFGMLAHKANGGDLVYPNDYINRLPKLFDGDPNLVANGIKDPFTSSLDLGSSSYNNNFGFQHPENPGLATNDASTPNSNAPNMGVYGMAAGQAAGLVKAIGSGKGKDGTDTTGSIIGSDVLSGAAAGTAVLPGIGTAVGAGIGAIKSVFDVSSNNKLRKTIEQDKINTYNTNTQMRYNTDKANLSNFNSKGNQTNSLYANGGDLDETMDNQNNEYFRNRVNEIGLSGATKEYNDFFDITPDKGKGKKKFAMKNYAD